MDYISVKEAALKWGIDVSRIGRLAREGRIEGARIVGRNWLIPTDAQKPCDKRMARNKSVQKADYFHFPLLINRANDYGTVPLSEEERELQTAQMDFFSCDFVSAVPKFNRLLGHCDDKYIRICSLFFMCLLSMEYDSNLEWNRYYTKLQFELAGDFPHKKEMELFSSLLYVYLTDLQSVSDSLTIDPEYRYHPSCCYLYMYLTFFHFVKVSPSSLIASQLEIYELLSQRMEHDHYYFEAQELHRILFVSYTTLQNKKMLQYHLRQLLRIAYERNLLFTAADIAPYYEEYFQTVLNEFPAEFAEKIRNCSNPMYDNFARFTEKYRITEIYSLLSKKDYQILLYIYGGCSNKKIAEFMNISEHTVSNRLTAIYEKFDLKNRKELLEFVTGTLQYNHPDL